MSGQVGHHEVKPGSERSFGIVFAVLFTAIGLWPLLDTGSIRIWALLVAAVLLILGFLVPNSLTVLNILWFKFGMLLGRIITPVVISVLFTVAVIPTGVIMRMFRKDILRLKIDKSTKSYWINRSESELSTGSMKKQF